MEPVTDHEAALRDGEAAVQLPAQTDAGVYFIGTIHTPWRQRSECPHQEPGDVAAVGAAADHPAVGHVAGEHAVANGLEGRIGIEFGHGRSLAHDPRELDQPVK